MYIVICFGSVWHRTEYIGIFWSYMGRLSGMSLKGFSSIRKKTEFTFASEKTQMHKESSVTLSRYHNLTCSYIDMAMLFLNPYNRSETVCLLHFIFTYLIKELIFKMDIFELFTESI